MLSKKYLALIFIFLISGCSTPRIASQSKLVDRTVASSQTAQHCAVERPGKDAWGNDVIICTELFNTRPYLRLDKNQISSNSIDAYGVLEEVDVPNDDVRNIPGYRSFYLRTRTDRFALRSANGGILSQFPRIGDPWLQTEYTIYKVRGDLSKTDSGTINVLSVEPQIIVSGCAMDGLFAGTWTANLTVRNDDGSGFERHRFVPVTISIHELKPFKLMEDVENSDPMSGKELSLKDGATYALIGTIDNFYQSSIGPSGTLPSLMSLGKSNPFLGATSNKIAIMRYSSMHAAGTMNLAITWPAGSAGFGSNGMNYDGPNLIDINNLIRGDLDPELTKTVILPHAGSAGFKVDQLRLASPGNYKLTCPAM